MPIWRALLDESKPYAAFASGSGNVQYRLWSAVSLLAREFRAPNKTPLQ